MGLIAYIRYDHNGRIVPGGPIVTGTKPAVGNWQVVTEGTNVTLVGQLRAFVKLDSKNKPLAGSLFLGKSKPATGKWLEVNATYQGSVAPNTSTTTSTTTGIPVYTIGQQALGGTVAYILQPGDPGYDANAQHGLIINNSDLGQIQWGCYIQNVNTQTSFGSGLQNTIDINNTCAETNFAARACLNLVSSGYDDWYLPSYGELSVIVTNANIIGGFTNNAYWSSSQISADKGFFYEFSSSQFAFADKWITFTVRPIRSF